MSSHDNSGFSQSFLKMAECKGLVEYHLDMTSRTPLPVMGENKQATVDVVEEYRDVFSDLGKVGCSYLAGAARVNICRHGTLEPEGGHS